MAMDALIVQKNKQPEATSRRGWHGNALHSAGASGVRAGLRRRCFIRPACSDTAVAVPLASKAQLGDPLGVLRTNWNAFCPWVGVCRAPAATAGLASQLLRDMLLRGRISRDLRS